MIEDNDDDKKEIYSLDTHAKKFDDIVSVKDIRLEDPKVQVDLKQNPFLSNPFKRKTDKNAYSFLDIESKDGVKLFENKAFNAYPKNEKSEIFKNDYKETNLKPFIVESNISDFKSFKNPDKCKQEYKRSLLQTGQETKLPEKKIRLKLSTGEENDISAFKCFTKVHKFNNNDTKWIDCGSGTLTLNDINHDEKVISRIVVREIGSQKVRLNSIISADSRADIVQDRSIRLNLIDSETNKFCVFLLTSKDSVICKSLHRLLVDRSCKNVEGFDSSINSEDFPVELETIKDKTPQQSVKIPIEIAEENDEPSPILKK